MSLIVLLISVLLLIIVLILVYDTRKSARILSKREVDFKSRDTWSLSLGILGGILLIVTLFMVYGTGSFTDETGWMGDTIGGVTAPFVNGLAAILVYLALKAQIDANRLIQEQFNKEREEKREDLNDKLELLKLDLDSIKKNLIRSTDNLLEYSKSEISNPYRLNLLKQTVSKTYERVGKLHRTDLYKAFKLNHSSKDDWIERYHKTHDIIDFLSESFPDIYRKYNGHVENQFKNKIRIRELINDLMNTAALNLKTYKDRYKILDYNKLPAFFLTNKLILDWYAFLESPKGGDQGKTETDLLVLSNTILIDFNTNSLELIQSGNPERELMQLVEKVRYIRGEITLIGERGKEFGNSVRTEYNNYRVDVSGRKSILTQLNEILTFLN